MSKNKNNKKKLMLNRKLSVEDSDLKYRLPVDLLKEHGIDVTPPFNKTKLESFWQLGYNVEEYSVILHKEPGEIAVRGTNKRYTGYSLLGIERTDQEWLNSGCASTEAHQEAFRLRYGSDLREMMEWEDIDDTQIL